MTDWHSVGRSAHRVVFDVLRAPAVLAGRLLDPPPPEERLVVFDDMFPCLQSSVRVTEFSTYLESFPTCRVFSTGTALSEGEHRTTFSGAVREYARWYPQLADKALRYHPFADFRGKAAYAVFLDNAVSFLPAIERHGLPFAFTLYPGGGFRLRDKTSDDKLRRVCASPLLRKIIVTEPLIRDCLIGYSFCHPSLVEMVFGAVLPTDYLVSALPPRKRKGVHKDTFDVCFVAPGGAPAGADRGLDLFVEIARPLAAAHPDMRFHVVGTPARREAGTVPEGQLLFHGSRTREFFPAFYAGMDIILSPNASPHDGGGAFESFPTTACAEAAICGAAVMCTDELKQNTHFKDGAEIVVVPRDTAAIAARIEALYADYRGLLQLAERGCRAFRHTYSLTSQMAPRLRVISQLLANGAA